MTKSEFSRALRTLRANGAIYVDPERTIQTGLQHRQLSERGDKIGKHRENVKTITALRNPKVFRW